MPRMKTVLIPVILLFAFLHPVNGRSGTRKIVSFDGLEISCIDSLKPKTQTVVLLHGFASNKEEWLEFGQTLSSAGISYIAFDARGHGESVKYVTGQKLDYKNFAKDSPQWFNMLKDLDYVIKFLRDSGIDDKNIVICGASMGANMALIYSAMYNRKGKAILLSGSYNSDALTTMSLDRLMVCASKNDYGAFSELQKYIKNYGKDKRFVFYTGAKGHGVNMFDGIIEKRIAAFIKSTH